MAGGLVALLDDVAALTRLAAASLDDVGAAAGRAGAKAAGVVIDDAAVTPSYVAGISPERELPIIRRIAQGSLINKLLILLPVALLLSAFAPWALTPLLTLGGLYLCFEGAEKVLEAVSPHDHAPDLETKASASADPLLLESATVGGAVRTDLILSAEIMTLTLATVAEETLLTRAIVLALVGAGVTAGVYGAVAVIVKMDDVGLHLSKRGGPMVRAFGRGLVKAMPVFMRVLSVVGTAAMTWVGGGILIHAAATYGFDAPERMLHHAGEVAGRVSGPLAGAVAWLIGAAGAFLVGLTVGGVLVFLAGLSPWRKAH